MPIWDHLEELRERVLVAGLVAAASVLACFCFSKVGGDGRGYWLPASARKMWARAGIELLDEDYRRLGIYASGRVESSFTATWSSSITPCLFPRNTVCVPSSAHPSSLPPSPSSVPPLPLQDLVMFLELPVADSGVRFLQLSPGEFFFTTLKVRRNCWS